MKPINDYSYKIICAECKGEAGHDEYCAYLKRDSARRNCDCCGAETTMDPSGEHADDCYFYRRSEHMTMTKKKSETLAQGETSEDGTITNIGMNAINVGEPDYTSIHSSHTPLGEVERALESVSAKLLAMQHDAYSSWLALAQAYVGEALDAVENHKANMTTAARSD